MQIIENREDLEKLTMTMTKEEFLKSDYVLNKTEGICPDYLGLKYCNETDNNNCIKCVIKALEDNNIKFKDDVIKEYPQGYLISEFTNIIYGEIQNEWTIELVKRWYELKNNETYDRIKFIKTNKSSNGNRYINIQVDVNNIDEVKNRILSLQAENIKLKNIIKEITKLNDSISKELKLGDNINVESNKE